MSYIDDAVTWLKEVFTFTVFSGVNTPDTASSEHYTSFKKFGLGKFIKLWISRLIDAVKHVIAHQDEICFGYEGKFGYQANTENYEDLHTSHKILIVSLVHAILAYRRGLVKMKKFINSYRRNLLRAIFVMDELLFFVIEGFVDGWGVFTMTIKRMTF